MTASIVENVRADDCYRCGYDLRGVEDDQPCPECGLLAGRSRRPSDELHHTRPGWLRRLAWGLRLILLALLVGLLSPLVTEFVRTRQATFTWGRWGPVPRVYAFWQHASVLWVDLAALLLLAGVVLLTSRERYEPADRADRRRRRWLRLAALPPLAAAGVFHVAAQIEFNATAALFSPAVAAGARWQAADTSWAPVAAFVLLTIGMVPLPILLMVQLRSLARRARHPQLAEDCAIVGVGNAVTLLYVPFLFLVMQYGGRLGTHWTGRSPVFYGLTIVLAVLSIVFALWNVYLLVRFWLAFARASRMLRSEWRRDDRSVNPAAAAGV